MSCHHQYLLLWPHIKFEGDDDSDSESVVGEDDDDEMEGQEEEESMSFNKLMARADKQDLSVVLFGCISMDQCEVHKN